MRVRMNGGVIGPTNPTTLSLASGVYSVVEAQLDNQNILWPTYQIITVDTYFNKTKLLIHGDGSFNANNNTFLDSSTNAFTLTSTGTPTQGSFSPFSQTGWSNYFGASNYLTVASNAAFSFGTGDFTIEFWLFPTASFSTTRIMSTYTGGIAIYPNNSGNIIVDVYGVTTRVTTTSTVSINTWTHIAVVRSSGTTTVYLNGVSGGSGADATSYTNSGLYIGTDNGTNSYTGYISNFRIVKGTAVYTTNFTPSTTPLTAVFGTSFLTCQSNRFVDNSGTSIALTTAGTPSVQAFSPFAPASAYGVSSVGGSVYLNGSTDYLTLGTNPSAIGTGDFTAEAWVYLTVNQDSTLYCAEQFRIHVAPTSISITQNGVVDINLTTTPNLLNSWNHVAWSRSGTTLRVFLNGALLTTVTGNSTNFTAGTTRIGIESNSLISPFAGYISNLRIISGTAVYTSAFTPPTAPVTAITNTQLLVNGTNASIYDSTAKNNIQTSNGGFLSTTQSKFGGSSIRYPGGVYHITTAGPQNSLGNGDFTIEFWIWFDGVGSQRPLSQGTYAAGEYVLIFNANGSFDWAESGTTRCSAPSSTYSAGAWYHIAIVRSGLTTSAYVNGTQTGTTYTPASNYNFNSTAGIYIGGNPNTPSQTFTGYIDELRITVGVARYTANFSVATSAYPNQ